MSDDPPRERKVSIDTVRIEASAIFYPGTNLQYLHALLDTVVFAANRESRRAR